MIREDDRLRLCTDYPNEGAGQLHLMAALGVTDVNLYNALVGNLCNLARRSNAEISEQQLNDLLSMVRGIGPKDATEAMLAVQMAGIHSAVIIAARRLRNSDLLDEADNASNCLNKLSRTFAAQVEALKKHRSSGDQNVIVKHVHVYPGAQAVVGTVKRT